MPERSLDILVRIITQELGEAKANEVLAKVRAEADQLNQSLPEGWEGLEKYKKALMASGESAEAAGERIHSLRALMAGAGPEAAELGHLLHFALNPLMLAGAAMAGGMEAFFHWLEKAQERQREMISDLSKYNDFLRESVKLSGNIYDQMHAIRQATDDAVASQHSLTNALKEFDERAAVFNMAQNDALQERIDLRSQESGLLEDQLKLLENIGKITTPQGEQDRIEIEHQKRLAEIKDKTTKDKSDYESAKSDYDEKLKMAGGPQAFSPEAQGAAKGAVDAAQQKLDQDRHAAETAADQKIEEINQAIDKNKNLRNEHPFDYNKYTETIQELERQKNEIQAGKAKATPEVEQDEKDLAAAKQHAQDIAGLVDTFAALKAKLDELRQKWTDDQAGARAATLEENQRASAEKTNALVKAGQQPNDIFNQGLSAMEVLDHMKEQTGFSPQDYLERGTPEQKAYIQTLQNQVKALGDLETAIGNNGDAFLGAINRIVMLSGTHEEALRQTHQYAANIEQKLKDLMLQINSSK
jgi:chromosome segregation ATPase